MKPISRLRRWCAVLYIGLLLPSAFLVWQGWNNLRYQSFHNAHTLAEALVQQMGERLQSALAAEEARSATDYDFFVVSGEQYIRRSPLADLAPEVDLPGLVGFVEVDQSGSVSTPFVPPEAQTESASLSERELTARRSREGRLKELVQAKAAPPLAAERAMLDELELNLAYEEADTAMASAPAPARQKLKQESKRVLTEAVAPTEDVLENITSIVAEVDPLSISRLDEQHLFAHRRVYIDNQIKVQGFVMEIAPFVERYFTTPFFKSALGTSADLVIALNNEVLSVLQASGSRVSYTDEQLSGTVLLRTRLAAPANAIELVINARELPLGAGATTLLWTALTLLTLLTGGIWLIYRLGRQQIVLAEQQRDFVASVSHELKTPLTAIRMYGEMLRAGWADEDKKRTYYDFIFNESERLSRLISNVLQLARLEKSDPESLEPQVDRTAGGLLDLLKERSASLADAEGFEIDWQDNAGSATVSVAEDAWVQIMLNLMDNGIKFSREAEDRRLLISATATEQDVCFSVRDHGPGVAREQMKRIFEMFYRAEDELTRETTGTGIGLSLVRRLAGQMGGSVDVANRSPGAEFTVRLPRKA